MCQEEIRRVGPVNLRAHSSGTVEQLVVPPTQLDVVILGQVPGNENLEVGLSLHGAAIADALENIPAAEVVLRSWNIGAPRNSYRLSQREPFDYLTDSPAGIRGQKLVRVQSQNPVGIQFPSRGSQHLGRHLGLEEAAATIVQQLYASTFCCHGLEDVAGAIAAEIVGDDHLVAELKVVANERFDDVRFVTDHDDADNLGGLEALRRLQSGLPVGCSDCA